MLAYAALLMILVAGYPAYLSYRNRQLEKRIKRCGNDPDLIMAELDADIQKTTQEAEFFKQQSGKGNWL